MLGARFPLAILTVTTACGDGAGWVAAGAAAGAAGGAATGCGDGASVEAVCAALPSLAAFIAACAGLMFLPFVSDGDGGFGKVGELATGETALFDATILGAAGLGVALLSVEFPGGVCCVDAWTLSALNGDPSLAVAFGAVWGAELSVVPACDGVGTMGPAAAGSVLPAATCSCGAGGD